MGDRLGVGWEGRPMPWKETCRMDEKLSFVVDYLRGEWSMAALCGGVRHQPQGGLQHQPQGGLQMERLAIAAAARELIGRPRTMCMNRSLNLRPAAHRCVLPFPAPPFAAPRPSRPKASARSS